MPAERSAAQHRATLALPLVRFYRYAESIAAECSMPDRTPTTIANAVSPVLPVRDVAEALQRYESMGFVTRAYQHEPDANPVYAFVCMGPTEYHVTCVTDLDASRNTSAVYLYVDDADEVFERWKAAVDGRFHGPEDTEYGLREFGYVDPDGNLFRVGSSLGE